jgi:hypothetical protein
MYALVNLIDNSWVRTAPRRAVALAPVYVGDAGPAASARAVGHLKRTGIQLLAAGSCSNEVDGAYSGKNRVNHWRVEDRLKTHSWKRGEM